MSSARKIAAIICCFLLSGCATTVNLQVKKAPELNMAGAKIIKINPFKVSGYLDQDITKLGGGLLGTVIGIAADGHMEKKAESKHAGFQESELNAIKDIVTKDGYYQITEGSDYDAVLDGSIHYSVKDTGQERKDNYTNKGKVRRWYEITRQADVRVEFEAKNKSGVVLGASKVSTYSKSKVSGDNRDAARQNVPAWETLVKKALDQTPKEIIRKIAPYVVTEQRTLEKGESTVIQEGNNAAKKDDWPTALNYWKQGQTSDTLKDKVAANYNIGVYYEMEGNSQNALLYFEEAKKISGLAKYDADIARIKSKIEDENKLLQSPK